MKEMDDARYEVCLILEYIPHMLHFWLRRNLNKASLVVDQMRDVLSFLRRRGIVRFDSHHENILTDGEKLFLTDFGLVCDKSFELSERERVLLKENRYYDCGEFLCKFAGIVYEKLGKLPQKVRGALERKFGFDDATQPMAVRRVPVLSNLKQICAEGWIKLPSDYVDIVVNHRDAILVMFEFFDLMIGTNKKNHTYDRARLRRSLLKAGFIKS